MAVVQISKIQVRRGKKNTTGMPQLASGELAWAIDTQELYIGNGAVGEGAPAVGNTKVLTEHDNIIDLLHQYSYKPSETTISTGLPGPTERTLQQRLDEGSVNAKSFGIESSDTVDQTELLQNAIWSLYESTNPLTNSVRLEIDPGNYRLTGTIYVPSNVFLVGSGSGKTKFNFVKGGFNTGATLSLSGTSVTSAGTYTSLSTTTVTGTGSGAIVNVTKTGTGTTYTTSNVTVTVINSGSGYTSGDQIKISGGALGGTSPANDLTITLTNTKTGPNQYPTFATSKVFEFITADSTRLSRNPGTIATPAEQCQNVNISGFTLNTTASNQIMCFDMPNVLDSNLNDIDCVAYTGTSIVVPSTADANSIVLNISAISSVITTTRLSVQNVKAKGFSYGVFSNTDIVGNHLDDCLFEKCYRGISFGVGTGPSSTGPIRNLITNSTFKDIKREGIVIETGYGNRSRGNTFTRVGNDGGSVPLYPVLKFSSAGNSSSQDNFDRNELIRYESSVAYTPEIEGFGLLHESMPSKLNFNGAVSTPTLAFRLPLNDAVAVEVKYVWISSTLNQMRKGTIHIAVDRDRNTFQFVDEYEYTGAAGDDTKLGFTGAIGPTLSGIKTIDVMYTNTNPAGDNTFSYTYSILS